MIYKEAANPDIVNSGAVVFSKNGFVKLAKTKNETSDFVAKD